MKVVVADYVFKDLDPERRIFAAAAVELVAAQCKTPDELIAVGKDADALLVQSMPVNAQVIASLTKCRVIVRYGIGVDSVDLAAAKARGIAVCNVPDYCIDEVADHTVALALALARQIPAIDQRVRSPVQWSGLPVTPMAAFRDMVFATVGLGRIARAVLDRAKSFGFQLAAHDPYAPAVPDVASLSIDELFRQADILSLHAPLTRETKHLVNAARLRQMKATAILINTARGGLVDTVALAEALQLRTIAYAGLDVFENEPLPDEHPLRQCANALLTSHVAWYSQRSVPLLQRLAAEEVVRGLRGEPLKNQVNK